MDTTRYIFSRDYCIRSYELDGHKQASLQTLSCFLQETAIQHINALNIGINEILEQGLIWVLSRILIRVMRYPDWGEPVTVETWGPAIDRFDVHREFRILGKDRQPLCLASSTWLVINLNANRPEPSNTILKDFDQIHTERVLTGKLKKLPRMEDFDFQTDIQVKLRDLDFNGHVNNIKYLDWIIDGVPTDIQQKGRLAAIEINYLMAALYGDMVIVRTKRLDDGKPAFAHCLVRAKDNLPFVRAQTTWEL